jgi:hypothetical protein
MIPVCSYCGTDIKRKIRRSEIAKNKRFFCNLEHYRKYVEDNGINRNERIIFVDKCYCPICGFRGTELGLCPKCNLITLQRRREAIVERIDK